MTETNATASKVDHPPHYNAIPGIECIDVIKHFDFVIGNVIKYAWRAGLKPDASRLEDLRKMLWYADFAVKEAARQDGAGEDAINSGRIAKSAATMECDADICRSSDENRPCAIDKLWTQPEGCVFDSRRYKEME